MMTMLVLPGRPCLSPFRIARLRERLAAHAPGLRSLEVIDFFLVDGDALPMVALRDLLGPGPERMPTAQLSLFAVPRVGTTSPWCSKATDIARVSGLTGVRRIER